MTSSGPSFLISFSSGRTQTRSVDVITVSDSSRAWSIRNVSIVQSGNQIFINGQQVEDSDLGESRQVNIVVEGNADTVKTTIGAITVNGNVGSANSVSGDIEFEGDILGSLATTSGDVSVVGTVGGSVSTVSGDVRHRR